MAEIRPRPVLGFAMAISFVMIWTVWIVATRQAVQTTMTPVSIAVIRFSFPALVFLPWYWRRGIVPKGVDRRLLFLVVCGAGAPMLFVVASGMAFAPAADIGALLPGTMPLFAALLGWFVVKEAFESSRILGFALIACGVVMIAGSAVVMGSDGAWRGHGLFLCGGFLWATYTHAFKQSGLDTFQAAGLIGFWSLVMVIPFALYTGGGGLLSLSAQEFGTQLIIQGLFAGIFSLVAYGLAVANLGATKAAAFGSLVPALVAVLAMPMLGEIPTWLTGLAIVAITIGVILASGQVPRIFNRKIA